MKNKEMDILYNYIHSEKSIFALVEKAKIEMTNGNFSEAAKLWKKAIYGNLYLGQGYADWQERNNSHKMIY
jgi:hypothetical protein